MFSETTVFSLEIVKSTNSTVFQSIPYTEANIGTNTSLEKVDAPCKNTDAFGVLVSASYLVDAHKSTLAADLGTAAVGDSDFEYGSIDSAGNDIITKMMRHALSIQTYDFETPRYLRII